MAEEPDPQLQPILEMVEEVPAMEELGVEAAREQFTTTMVEFFPSYDVYDEFDISIPGPETELDARVYKPGEGTRPVVVYFHGGGFVVGNLDTHDHMCQKLANESGWTVVSVAYRLAPEFPFPAFLEDAYAATEWLARNPAAVDGTGTIAVAGDSAGGNLAAGVSLMARDVAWDVSTTETGPSITHQVLFYPVTGSAFREFDSRTTNAEGYFLERGTMEWFHDNYVASRVHERNEYLSPLLVDDLSGLPPATVITAAFDPLRDEGDEYAEAMAAAGVDVVHQQFDGMVHGFASFLGMVDASDEAIDLAASGLDSTR